MRPHRRRLGGRPHPRPTGVDMKAFQAATAANRISDCAILVGGGLCGVLVFTVALPLALSSPFPTPKHVDWAQPASSPVSAAASPPTYSVASLQLPPKRT